MAQWAKGRSGNPHGRPQRRTADGKALAELARAYSEEALAALVEVMRNGEAPAGARISAATAILDRGWGRPIASHEATGANGGPASLARLHSEAKRADEVASMMDALPSLAFGSRA